MPKPLKIEKNIPLPKQHSKAESYPELFLLSQQMTCSDSVLFRQSEHPYKSASYLSQLIKLQGFKSPIRTIRKFPSKELIGWRVWKLENTP